MPHLTEACEFSNILSISVSLGPHPTHHVATIIILPYVQWQILLPQIWRSRELIFMKATTAYKAKEMKNVIQYL